MVRSSFNERKEQQRLARNAKRKLQRQQQQSVSEAEDRDTDGNTTPAASPKRKISHKKVVLTATTTTQRNSQRTPHSTPDGTPDTKTIKRATKRTPQNDSNQSPQATPRKVKKTSQPPTSLRPSRARKRLIPTNQEAEERTQERRRSLRSSSASSSETPLDQLSMHSLLRRFPDIAENRRQLRSSSASSSETNLDDLSLHSLRRRITENGSLLRSPSTSSGSSVGSVDSAELTNDFTRLRVTRSSSRESVNSRDSAANDVSEATETSSSSSDESQDAAAQPPPTRAELRQRLRAKIVAKREFTQKMLIKQMEHNTAFMAMYLASHANSQGVYISSQEYRDAQEYAEDLLDAMPLAVRKMKKVAHKKKQTRQERAAAKKAAKKAANNESHKRRHARKPGIKAAEVAKRREDSQRQEQLNVQAAVAGFFGNGDGIYDESAIPNHYMGKMDAKCPICGALHFQCEIPSDGLPVSCCSKGKVKLADTLQFDPELDEMQTFPEPLRKLMLDEDDAFNSDFMQNILLANSMMSFGSINANVMRFTMPNAPQYNHCFVVNGRLYHETENRMAADPTAAHCAQIYMLGVTQAISRRQALSGINNQLLSELSEILQRENAFARQYYTLKQKLDEFKNNKAVPILRLAFNKNYNRPDMHPGQQNAPTEDECLAVIVDTDNNGELPFPVAISVYAKDTKFGRPKKLEISSISPLLEPMLYPFFYPHGQPGWMPTWLQQYPPFDQWLAKHGSIEGHSVSALEHASARMAYRSEKDPRFTYHLYGRDLFLQWCIDAYLRVESSRLNFFKVNQEKLMKGRFHEFKKREDKNQPLKGTGVPYKLPSCFEGSPQNMRQKNRDSNAIFNRHGMPQLFITMTTNVHWQEIVENLMQGQAASDRPDLICRVFHQKLKAFLKDIVENELFGPVAAYVYTIEFQKRGLPHAHILVTLKDKQVFNTAEEIERTIWAEIPDEKNCPRLFKIVSGTMVHICSERCRSTDMNSKCRYQFPKPYNQFTIVNPDGSPIYRRMDNSDNLQKVGKKVLDNRYVVPYNPYLSLRYASHINVEVCRTNGAIRYLYKYLHKGYDVAGYNLIDDRDQIQDFIAGRYISSVESVWRLLKYPLSGHSHAVIRLPIHREGDHMIEYAEHMNDAEILNKVNLDNQLLGFFRYNQENPTAKAYAYPEFPIHFVWNKRTHQWTPRKQRGDKIVARIEMYGVMNPELLAERALLLNRKGSTSFEDLRTVAGVLHPTNLAAAKALNIILDDDIWEATLAEIAGDQNLNYKAQRRLFAFLIEYFTDPSKAWEEFWDRLTKDLKNKMSDDDRKNYGLLEIKSFILNMELKERLPATRGKLNDFVNPYIAAAFKPLKLNAGQQKAYDVIVNAAMDQTVGRPNCFRLDGPGGSGKTTTYRQIIHFLDQQGKKVMVFATTGIAATLLQNGRTVHSGFRLPVPCYAKSSANIPADSPAYQEFEEVDVIFIDEDSMMSSPMLEVIDSFLRTVGDERFPFGGKVMVLGGDFRQLLPILEGAGDDAIIKNSIIERINREFQTLELTENMRSIDPAHNQWLLDLGNGTTPKIPELGSRYSENYFEVPKQMLSEAMKKGNKQDAFNVMVREIYTNNITSLTKEELSRRIILAPTNKEVNRINNSIVSSLQGAKRTYLSFNETVVDVHGVRPMEAVENLEKRNPSGVPFHSLTLAVGGVVMLMKNLRPIEGLSNGTRLIVLRLYEHSAFCEIISEKCRGDIVIIPRMQFDIEDPKLPYKMRRTQLPLANAAAMTINKSQGSTMDYVGIILTNPCFAHGQAYVAFSRCTTPDNIKVYVDESSRNQGRMIPGDDRVFTRNVVYKQFLAKKGKPNAAFKMPALPPRLQALNKLKSKTTKKQPAIPAVQQAPQLFFRFTNTLIVNLNGSKERVEHLCGTNSVTHSMIFIVQNEQADQDRLRTLLQNSDEDFINMLQDARMFAPGHLDRYVQRFSDGIDREKLQNQNFAPEINGRWPEIQEVIDIMLPKHCSYTLMCQCFNPHCAAPQRVELKKRCVETKVNHHARELATLTLDDCVNTAQLRIILCNTCNTPMEYCEREMKEIIFVTITYHASTTTVGLMDLPRGTQIAGGASYDLRAVIHYKDNNHFVAYCMNNDGIGPIYEIDDIQGLEVRKDGSQRNCQVTPVMMIFVRNRMIAD